MFGVRLVERREHILDPNVCDTDGGADGLIEDIEFDGSGLLGECYTSLKINNSYHFVNIFLPRQATVESVAEEEGQKLADFYAQPCFSLLISARGGCPASIEPIEQRLIPVHPFANPTRLNRPQVAVGVGL